MRLAAYAHRITIHWRTGNPPISQLSLQCSSRGDQPLAAYEAKDHYTATSAGRLNTVVQTGPSSEKTSESGHPAPNILKGLDP